MHLPAERPCTCLPIIDKFAVTMGQQHMYHSNSDEQCQKLMSLCYVTLSSLDGLVENISKLISQSSGGCLGQCVQESIGQSNALMVYFFESFLQQSLVLDGMSHGPITTYDTSVVRIGNWLVIEVGSP